MGSGDLQNYEARPRDGSRPDYYDDPKRRWKNSLRPLDPGILSDVKRKKKERFDLQIKQRQQPTNLEILSILLFLDPTAWPAVHQGGESVL